MFYKIESIFFLQGGQYERWGLLQRVQPLGGTYLWILILIYWRLADMKNCLIFFNLTCIITAQAILSLASAILIVLISSKIASSGMTALLNLTVWFLCTCDCNVSHLESCYPSLTFSERIYDDQFLSLL